MKRISLLIYISCFLAIFTGCVDNYEDANPAPLLDSPASQLSVSKDSLKGGETVTLSIAVIDAPGKIDSIGVSSTDDLGSFTIDESTFNAAKGKEKGSIKITYTAPFDYEGEVELSILVYDAQVDDKGESSKKSFTLNQTVFVQYLYAKPSFNVDFAESLYKGEVYDFEININDVPSGGVDTVIAMATEGEIQLDESSLLAILGKKSGKVTGTYTAPLDFVGDVDVIFTVVDELQQRDSIISKSVEIDYEFDIPSISISGPDKILARVTGSFEAGIQADGVIDSVIVQAFKRNTEEEVGKVEIDEASYNALVGETSGTLTFDFSEGEYLGYVDLVVTVIDEQGAQSSEKSLLLNEQNCEFNIDDFTGDFSAEEPGYDQSPYDVTFTADPDVENRIVIDNFWDFSGTPYYDINPDTKVITLPLQVVVMGGDNYTVQGSGMIDLCKGSFYIDYTVKDSDGVLQEDNTHTYTKL